MSRYFVLVEERAEVGDDSDDELTAPVCIGRSFTDMADALAYSVWLFDDGSMDSRREREYIELEREAFTFRCMVKNMKL
jgi:hypothetical protein